MEIQAPERQRVFLLPVTVAERADGRPTSWSAAIDLLAAGCAFQTDLLGDHHIDPVMDGPKRLYIISAGNVEGALRLDYPDLNHATSIETPGQAWNALTVGACTERIHIDPDHRELDGWTPLAERGHLSPYSTTSLLWDDEWPTKPDIVMEGGNIAVSPNRTETSAGVDDFSLLTTSATPDRRLLTTTWATSAACAQAAALAARLIARYPTLRPETIRGLMVHAARWTEPMQAAINPASKSERARLLRQFGFGKLDERRALASVDNALTLMAEREINAYTVGDDNQTRLGEIHLHALPWPREALEALHETDVVLRVTLSYFIEPNPGERGWRGRYRYASHGLRFDMKTAVETDHQFHLRLNRLAEEDRQRETDSDSERWVIGPRFRRRGSLHHDIWTGSASELAAKGTIAVYPVGGWWGGSLRV